MAGGAYMQPHAHRAIFSRLITRPLGGGCKLALLSAANVDSLSVRRLVGNHLHFSLHEAGCLGLRYGLIPNHLHIDYERIAKRCKAIFRLACSTEVTTR